MRISVICAGWLRNENHNHSEERPGSVEQLGGFGFLNECNENWKWIYDFKIKTSEWWIRRAKKGQVYGLILQQIYKYLYIL